jgi:sulfite dehydrogenase
MRRRSTKLRVVIVAAGLVCLALSGGAAAQRTFSLPAETAAFQSSDLPGYQLVLRNCTGCHSADYAAMQPPGSTRAYWDATVKKMKKPFGAPFPEEDIPAMVEYLVKTYGAERASPAH